VLYAQGDYWKSLALSFETADVRSQEIAKKIAEARRKQGDDEDVEDDEDESSGPGRK
jgi:hypothetical protein